MTWAQASKTNAAGSAKSNKFALGYVHNLSKRTAIYGNYSVVTNDGIGKTFSVGDGLTPTDAGGNSTGAQLGLRHSF